MGKIIACYKWVKIEDDLRIDPNTLNVDLSKAKGKISDYDRNAIEAARLLGEASGDDVIGLTYGGEDTKPSLKDAMSRGLQEGYRVVDPQAETADGHMTAKALSAAVKKIGDYSLVVCAEGAADTYAHQVGPRIGAMLNIPTITFVKEANIENGKIVATRKLENSLEKVEATLPAVITVLPEMNAAPIPGLKAVLDAGKRPVTEFKIEDLDIDKSPRKTQVKSFKGCTTTRKNILFSEGDAKEKINALVGALKKEGVL